MTEAPLPDRLRRELLVACKEKPLIYLGPFGTWLAIGWDYCREPFELWNYLRRLDAGR